MGTILEWERDSRATNGNRSDTENSISQTVENENHKKRNIAVMKIANTALDQAKAYLKEIRTLNSLFWCYLL